MGYHIHVQELTNLHLQSSWKLWLVAVPHSVIVRQLMSGHNPHTKHQDNNSDEEGEETESNEE